MPRAAERYRGFVASPVTGGQLITRGSSANIGHSNYTQKLDFRRDLDVEIRREGVDYFWPNLSLPVGGQPFPGQIKLNSLTYAAGVVTATRTQGQWFENGEQIIVAGANDPLYNGTVTIQNVTGTTFQYAIVGVPVSPDTSTNITATPIEEINFLGLARRPNGQTAVIAGSNRRLYRYFALDDPNYITEDPALWPNPEVPPYWSEDPADYPPGTPVDQLEYIDSHPGYWIVIGSGFSTSGKRWESVNINGYMVLNNATDLPVTYRVEEFSVVPIYQLREQGVAYAGSIAEINGILMLGDIAEIHADYLSTWFNTAANPYGRFTDLTKIDRTTYRVIWSEEGEPRNFAPVYAGSITAGTNKLTLQYPVLGIEVGDTITIVGAGASHSGGTADNLVGRIVNKAGTTIILTTFAQTTVTNAVIQESAQIGTIVGQEDLQADGSGIVKMLPISSTLVIYKDTTIFLAQYTGNVDQPFTFTELEVQPEAMPFYRNTVVLVQNGSELYQMYAGRNCFWRFDLTNQQPMSMAKFEACHNIFYSQATLANTDRIWGAQNGLSHEVIFSFPSGSDDKALLYDYKQDTLSTTGFASSAGATVRKPVTGLASGVEQDWFVLGTSDGSVLLYGLTTVGNNQGGWSGGTSIFYRRYGNPYNATRNAYPSRLRSGLASFGNTYAEKQLRAFQVLMGSQSANTPINVQLLNALNPNSTPVLVGAVTLSDPLNHNNIPVGMMGYMFQSLIEVAGIDNPIRLAGSFWDVAPLDTRSISRSI